MTAGQCQEQLDIIKLFIYQFQLKLIGLQAKLYSKSLELTLAKTEKELDAISYNDDIQISYEAFNDIYDVLKQNIDRLVKLREEKLKNESFISDVINSFASCFYNPKKEVRKELLAGFNNLLSTSNNPKYKMIIEDYMKNI